MPHGSASQRHTESVLLHAFKTWPICHICAARQIAAHMQLRNGRTAAREPRPSHIRCISQKPSLPRPEQWWHNFLGRHNALASTASSNSLPRPNSWIPAACRRSVWQYERRGSASRYPLQHHTDRSPLIHRCLRMQLDQIIGCWSLLWAMQTANVNLQGCQSCSQAVASEIGASCPQCLRQASHLSLRPPQMHEVHSICFSALCRQRWPILWRLPPRFWVSSIARGPSHLLCSHWARRHETML